MQSLYKILVRENELAKKYFKDYIFYVKKIKKIVKQIFSDAKVIVFGSIVTNKYSADSDIDILIVSDEIPKGLFEQAKIKVMIKNKFKLAPFEIHLATKQEYENWYKNFIKKNFIEV